MINLEYADIENKSIPQSAFYDKSVQGDLAADKDLSIKLRRITLPSNLEIIENSAFLNAQNLEEINLPGSLMEIDYDAFMKCANLRFDGLSIPSKVKKIGGGAFSGCKAITGRLTLPPSIQIGNQAFSGSGITAVDIPEGAGVGQAAFGFTDLEEVYIAGSSMLDDMVFADNKNLKKITMAEGMTYMPMRLAINCSGLEEIRIPSTMEDILMDALMNCTSLKSVELPDGLVKIDPGAFNGLESLEEIVFRSSLRFIDGCSGWKSIRRIYSTSPEPPLVYVMEAFPRYTAFGDKEAEPGTDTPRDTPVYVPVGSAEKYRTAAGWDYFTNFIETDQFPANGISEINEDVLKKDNNIYDLQGRKIRNPSPGQIYIRNGKKIINKY